MKLNKKRLTNALISGITGGLTGLATGGPAGAIAGAASGGSWGYQSKKPVTWKEGLKSAGKGAGAGLASGLVLTPLISKLGLGGAEGAKIAGETGTQAGGQADINPMSFISNFVPSNNQESTQEDINRDYYMKYQPLPLYGRGKMSKYF